MKRKIGIIALAALVAIGATACHPAPDPNVVIDFTSYNADAGFYVDNLTTHRLIAYKGSLHSSNLLGGIPAGAEYHGIKRAPAFFDRTHAFPVILITEEQYNANKDNLRALDQTPFTRIFVFYNHGNEQGNPARYAISGKLGGRHRLTIENNTGLDVEIRIDGPEAETLGYAPRQMLVTHLNLNDGDVNIFPVFRFYNPVRGVVSAIYPKMFDGTAWYFPFAASGATPTHFALNVRDALDAVPDRTIGAAWIVFRNQSATAVGIAKGGTLITDTLGFNYIGTVSPNNQRVIVVNMASIGDYVFAEKVTEGGYQVGPAANRVDVVDAAGNTTFELETDMQYVVNITGNFLQGTLKAVIDLAGATPVTIEDLLAEN
ncbi:MAG: hypothetical protein FWE09_00770 [Treponema sp.]|nr:hypothetical protein [Treponema sp.]